MMPEWAVMPHKISFVGVFFRTKNGGWMAGIGWKIKACTSVRRFGLDGVGPFVRTTCTQTASASSFLKHPDCLSHLHN